MSNALLLLPLILLPAAPAAAFERLAGSMPTFMEAARELEVPAAQPERSHHGNIYFSTDCARLELGGGEGPRESGVAVLYSQEFVEECRPLPPNELGLIIEHCYSRPLRAWTRTVRLRAAPSPVPAGGKEVFEVCLAGPLTRLRAVSVFNSYSVKKEGEEDVVFMLTPAKAGGAHPR